MRVRMSLIGMHIPSVSRDLSFSRMVFATLTMAGYEALSMWLA